MEEGRTSVLVTVALVLKCSAASCWTLVAAAVGLATGSAAFGWTAGAVAGGWAAVEEEEAVVASPVEGAALEEQTV